MIEYFIYTLDDEPVEVAALKDTLNAAGWEMHAVRHWYERDRFEVVTGGELQDADWTLAHRNGDPLAADIQRALAHKDVRALEQWINTGNLSFATWYHRKFSFAQHSEFESLDDARRQCGDMYADFLTETRRQYIVQHGLHPEFGAAAMGAVAMLRNGIVEDPQLGLVLPPPADVSGVATFIEKWPTDNLLPAAARAEPSGHADFQSNSADGTNQQSRAARGWWGWVDETGQSKWFSMSRTARLLIVIFGGYAIAVVPILLIQLWVYMASQAKQEQQQKEKMEQEWAETMKQVQQGQGGEAFKRLFSPEARPPGGAPAGERKSP